MVNGQPVEATAGNSPYNDGVLSVLPGQRLSRCTCPGESHPGPMHDNGDFVGRSAPEIDMFEAQVRDHNPDSTHLCMSDMDWSPQIGGTPLGKVGGVSQSAQWAVCDSVRPLFNVTDAIHAAFQLEVQPDRHVRRGGYHDKPEQQLSRRSVPAGDLRRHSNWYVPL